MDKSSNLLHIGIKALQPNSKLTVFEPFIGNWRTTGEHPYLPDTKLTGKTSFEWIEGGSILIMRTEIDHPKIPDGIAIIGSDANAGTYHMIYFDERDVSRKFEVAITDNGFRWWRQDSHLSQRVTLGIENDGLVSNGEMSRDGGDWEKDLCLLYKKL